MSWAPWKWRGGKKPPKADLGKELDMYWNEELNRWVEQGKEDEYRKEAEATAAPPKCGPASGPASYTLERTSLQNRYVQTPGISSTKAAGRETPPASFGSFIPKANGKLATANIFVPPRPEPSPEADEAKEPTISVNDGASVGSVELEPESNGAADSEGNAVNSRMGRRSRSLEDTLWSTDKVEMRGSDFTPAKRAGSSPEDDEPNVSKHRTTGDGGSSSFWDNRGAAADVDMPLAGSGFGLDEDAKAETGLPGAESLLAAEGGGGGLDESEAHSWTGGDLTGGLDDDFAQRNDGEVAKDDAELTFTNQNHPARVEGFSWIYGGWTDEQWQKLAIWLDKIYKRENWKMWSAEDWTQFWMWYQHINYSYYGQQDGQVTGPKEGEALEGVPLVINTDGMEEETSNNHSFSNPQELLSLEFGGGLNSRNDQSGYVADSPESRSQHTHSMDSPGAVLTTEMGNGSELSPACQTGSLEAGPVQTSCENAQAGPQVHGVESDTSFTPLVGSSPEFGVFGGDGQVLKKRSKLQGPLPWDEDSDQSEDEDMPNEMPNEKQAASATLHPDGEQKGQTMMGGDEDKMATYGLAPISAGHLSRAVENQALASTKEDDMKPCLPGIDVINEQGYSTTAGQRSQASHSFEHCSVSNHSPQQDATAKDLCANKILGSATNVSGGVGENQQHFYKPGIRTAEPAVQPQDLSNFTVLDATDEGELAAVDASNSADFHAGAGLGHQPVQNMENTNGKIVGIPLINGLLVGSQVNGADMGAMLLELRALLDFVDLSIDGVLERKEKVQIQLAHLIDTWNMGDHALKAPKNAHPPSVAVKEHAQFEPDVEDAPEVEKITKDMSGVQDDMDDMALALGLESRKVAALRRECERNGIDADTVLEEVEAHFGIEKDNFQDEGSIPTSPSDEMPVADISSHANSHINNQPSKFNSKPLHIGLHSTDPVQHLEVPANGDTGWHLNGVI